MELLMDDLLKKEENLWLEFKCCWKDVDENKVWGEFLKDFASLFNTYTDTNDTKYLIIGFDEIKKKCQNYNDNSGNILSVFNDIIVFKQNIVKKLKNHFKNIPLYASSSELPNIDTYFNVLTIKKEGVELLVFEIMPSPYLLELNKILHGNETFRDGNIITRKLKNDNSPEIINARSEDIEKLKKYVEKNKKDSFPEKILSIKKIVDVFKNKNFPASSIKEIAKEKNYSSGIFYEIYSIEGDYTPTIDFIYFSKYTNQKRSINNIKSNNLLNIKDKKIILIDERNKEGGVIDKFRINKLFQKVYFDTEVYYLDEFSAKKLYNGLIDDEIFHKESFNIHDFIQPLTDKSKDKTADVLLKEWYKSPDSPLVVLKGMGGIGKTTVVKYFLDDLYRKIGLNSINILFINSHDLIHDIMKNPKIDDVFDFYNILAEKHQVEKKFDKKNLELSIDDGNVIMVLDGLDEVIAKVGSKFNTTKFIESIFSDYSDNMGKAKIIITCRDYFWDKSIEKSKGIATLSLKPFTTEMAKNYFSKHFSTEKKVTKAISLAEEFSIKDGNTSTYIPYILDMIKEEILLDSTSDIVNSDILLNEGSINDFLVAKVCEREIIKLDNLSIDQQLSIFIDIAFKYEGILEEAHLIKLQEKKNINLEKFCAHPLVEYSKENKRLKFRYDFFNEYFKNIKLSLFIKNENFDLINEEMIDIFIQHISYDGSLMQDLMKRMENLNFENLKVKIYTFITEDLSKINIEKNSLNRLNSSMFILLLALDNANTKEKRTDLLKEIYLENGVVKNLCLINLHSANNSKITFDFSGLSFEECYFENFENFTDCSVDEKTFFRKCAFLSPLHRKGSHVLLNYKHFDQTTDGLCRLDGLIDVLEEQKKTFDEKNSDIRKVLKQVFKLFWQGSTFRQKLKDEIRKKMKNNNHIIDVLIKNGVIDEVKVVTTQKRHDRAYRLNTNYSNLRKIMEENESCVEFENIINMFKI